MPGSAGGHAEKAQFITGTSPRGRPNVPRLRELIKNMDLRGAVLTVDALHTVRDTAKALHRNEIDFVITVKENTPKLFAALDALP